MGREIAVLVLLVLAGCAAREADVTLDLEGTAVATGRPFRAAHPLAVAEGTRGINASLTWSGTGAALGMELYAPNGSRVALALPTNRGQLGLAVYEPPTPGTWALYVAGDVSATTPYQVRVHLPTTREVENAVVRSAEVRRGAFLEVDVRMDAGARVAYTVDASAPVSWELHSHGARGLVEWAAGEAVTSANGTFEAPEAGLYSLLAAPVDATAQVRLEVVGRFESHG